ncbi:serine hydrolase domain-containing protein [Microbacterium dextranolyticum]|uniref:Beta-lactamase-related domain-containing protein n=1 Tax=Microbacterium dextranolyticum TaxID=36806 RepID=A0A9W6HPL0_9MICO|nr:serine hydrolase domain-containing protein [Microbacterium dextranolyticum]MBM7462584.1 D-alanyl-D-alanine carboxypeptidase [Microbacterium dextranolyticum]GLJ96313.1 hypothetical protein GCM10017591_23760 [Microbacterium dextranolyticum]
MTVRRIRWTILTGAALLIAVLAACTAVPAPVPTTTEPSDAVFGDRMAASLLQWRASPSTGPFAYTIPGVAVAASRGDGAVVVAVSGDGDAGVALDPAATFHIGSMTKLFTAALIMQLDQEGVLALGDTIDRWFPAAPGGDLITVRMLLQHESGLSELDFARVGTATPQQLIDDVFTRVPAFVPGTAYEYLNAGYIVLGRIAELATATPYEQLVRTRFIQPLGLAHTYLDGVGTGPEAVNGFVLTCADGEGAACAGKGGTVGAQSPSPQWPGAWAAGSMVSSAADQAVWIRALVGGDVVDAGHLGEMLQVTPLSSQYYSAAYDTSGVPHVQLGEGAGIATWMVPGVGTCHGHAGAIPGSNGIAAYCPDSDLAIVILNTIQPAGLTPGYPGLTPLTAGVLWALGG